MLVDGGLPVRTLAVGRVEDPIEFRHNFVSKGADARGVPLSIAHRYTSVCIAGLIINDHSKRKSSAIGPYRGSVGRLSGLNRTWVGSSVIAAGYPKRNGRRLRSHKIPLNVVCDKVGGLLPKSRGPFATSGQAEEPGVAFEGCAEDSVVQR